MMSDDGVVHPKFILYPDRCDLTPYWKKHPAIEEKITAAVELVLTHMMENYVLSECMAGVLSAENTDSITELLAVAMIYGITIDREYSAAIGKIALDMAADRNENDIVNLYR